MKSLLKQSVVRLLESRAGQLKYQKLFNSLHSLSLAGLSYGAGALAEQSGEHNAITYFLKKSSTDNKLVIFDVGANVGQYSSVFYEFLGDDRGTIYSFEPSAKTYQALKKNVSDKKAIKIFNFGFGEKDKKVKLFSDGVGSGLASVYKRRLDHLKIDMDMSEEIELTTIDSFCVKNKIGHIDYLKIDVEGNELNTLEGAKTMMKKGAIDYIQFEFGGCNIDSRTYFQDFFYLLNDQYRIYRIVKDGLYPVDEYRESQEIFVTTNYLAERRA